MKIAVCGAMKEECEGLTSLLGSSSPVQVGAWSGWHGLHKQNELFVFQSQVGKVLAAALTQALISEIRPDAIIYTGIAGALTAALNIGDVVIGDSAVQHDLDATAIGFKRGEIPYSGSSRVEADTELVDQLMSCTLDDGAKIHRGTILSGDQFISGDRARDLHLSSFDGLAVEMEGAAVGYICNLHRVPWVLIRTISDRADGSAAAHFEEFLPSAARHSVSLVGQLLGKIN